MSRYPNETDAIDLAVRLSRETDAEAPGAPVTPPSDEFEKFVGRSLTENSFSRVVRDATDLLLAHGARLPVPTRFSLIAAVEHAIGLRRADAAKEKHPIL